MEKRHGRLEWRRTSLIHVPDYLAWLDEEQAWAGLRSVDVVEQECRSGETVKVESRYCLRSMTDEAMFAKTVRLHWEIKNCFQFAVDAVFRENDSSVRVGHAVENLAVARRLALQIFKHESIIKTCFKAKRLKAGRDEAYHV